MPLTTYRRKRTAVIAVALVVCLVGAIATLHRRSEMRQNATAEEVLYVSSPAMVKHMSLGYTGLAADVYWTRAVQYFGGKHHQRAMDYRLLPKLLDIATTLDPHLIVAYRFGSVFLAQRPPEGAGSPEKAVELVERGIRQNPNEWRLYYDLGFLQYMELRDPAAAGRSFARAAELPGAHPWLKVLAASMAQRGGELETARFLWTKVYENTEDPMIRANAIKHLRALEVDETVPKLQALARAYRERYGSDPAGFAPMVRLGWLRGIPVDPAGNPYRLLPGGRVLVADPSALPFIKEGLPQEEASPATVPQSK